uniref:isoprenylcysteine carboxyl methyltransferase family protein n=1 Tax=uncultured Caulobacter sp. TaxID=158749 RepID=UPI0025F48301|nr:isoprenylcysteine carboxylmethyltransferase family protein [uncultured Caulobacter sp.]
MTLSVAVLALVTLQRLAELLLARRNAGRLLARGGVEVGAGHYPFIVSLHAAWLVGLWIMAWDRPVAPLWMSLFVLLQLLRIWVIATLGDRWTTRIIALPGAPLVRRGPYRVLSHPNYAVVVAEIAVLPIAFGLPAYALIFSVLNAAMLWVRIRVENRALARLT